AEVNMFSAKPMDYLAVPSGNRLYGNELRPGRGERRLFPGTIVTLLAIVGVLLRRPSARVVLYVILLVVAFDVSLGLSGVSYPVLAQAFGVFRGLRAFARLGIFVVMFLGVLAAYGFAYLMDGARPAVRAVVCTLLVAGMLGEYSTTFPVVELAST